MLNLTIYTQLVREKKFLDKERFAGSLSKVFILQVVAKNYTYHLTSSILGGLAFIITLLSSFCGNKSQINRSYMA